MKNRGSLHPVKGGVIGMFESQQFGAALPDKMGLSITSLLTTRVSSMKKLPCGGRSDCCDNTSCLAFQRHWPAVLAAFRIHENLGLRFYTKPLAAPTCRGEPRSVCKNSRSCVTLFSFSMEAGGWAEPRRWNDHQKPQLVAPSRSVLHTFSQII
jgi:hypothetical protein